MWQRIADWLYRQSSVSRARQFGFEFAIVKDTEDPWKLGRIRVRYPWHAEGDMSDWIWPASGTASDGTGSTFHIPQVDDLVLVVFYGGDITRGAYLGSVWTPGGIGPRGQVKPRASLIQGYQPQDPNPETYDHNKSPNRDPQPYPEPPDGAWITNDPTTRVHEFKTKGGLRLLWEEFKRRLRLWTHPSTPFSLEVDHFDGDSVDPPRSTPYHLARLTSPNGTVLEVEEDGSAGDYTTKVVHHAGITIKIEYLGNGGTAHKLTILDPGGEQIVVDEKLKQVLIQDRNGGQVLLDAQAKVRKVTDAAGNQVVLDENAQSITVQSPGNLTITAGGNLTITASGTVTIDGATINIG